MFNWSFIREKAKRPAGVGKGRVLLFENICSSYAYSVICANIFWVLFVFTLLKITYLRSAPYHRARPRLLVDCRFFDAQVDPSVIYGDADPMSPPFETPSREMRERYGGEGGSSDRPAWWGKPLAEAGGFADWHPTRA